MKFPTNSQVLPDKSDCYLIRDHLWESSLKDFILIMFLFHIGCDADEEIDNRKLKLNAGIASDNVLAETSKTSGDDEATPNDSPAIDQPAPPTTGDAEPDGKDGEEEQAPIEDIIFAMQDPVFADSDPMPTISWELTQGDIRDYTVKISGNDECSLILQSYDDILGTSVKLADLDDGTYFICAFANIASGERFPAVNNSVQIEINRFGLFGDFSILGPASIILSDQPIITWALLSSAESYRATVSAMADCSAPIATYEIGVTSSFALESLADGQYYLCMDAFQGESRIATALNSPYSFEVAASNSMRIAKLTAAVKLSETGLYQTSGISLVSTLNRYYKPNFPLWTDGFNKLRWINLPPGAIINTLDMDDWVFPQGTVLWKQFGSNQRRLETRMLLKTGTGEGPTNWYSVSFKWNADDTDADLVAEEGEMNVSGTTLDIPTRAQCLTCHQGNKDFILGFSALQLSGDAPTPSALNLTRLNLESLITNAPVADPTIGGSPLDQSVLGYLHGNCSHCHNDFAPNDANFNLKHAVTQTSLLGAPAYATTVNQFAKDSVTYVIKGQDVGASLLHTLTNLRGPNQMPSIGSDVIDTDFITDLANWIQTLPATTPTSEEFFASDILPILTNSCSGCHFDQPPRINLQLFSVVSANKDLILTRIQLDPADPLYMPKVGGPIPSVDKQKLIDFLNSL